MMELGLVLSMFQVVYKKVEFPAVSFCNLNPIRRSQLYLEENVDLVDVIATLDQATEDQLSGVSQSSRSRRRRRRAVNDDVIVKLETPLGDMPFDGQRMKKVMSASDHPQKSESTVVDDGKTDANNDVTTWWQPVTDDYWTTGEPASAAGGDWLMHSEDVHDVDNDESYDAMAVKGRRKR